VFHSSTIWPVTVDCRFEEHMPLYPMSTAPRDGTLIWVRFHGFSAPVVGYWSNRFGLWLDDRDDGRARVGLVPEGWLPIGSTCGA
jgi:hypothetical protein